MAALSHRLAEIVDALPLRPGMRVIEIGCGPGAAARAVADRIGPNGHVLAVDRSARAIVQLTESAAGLIAEAGSPLVAAQPRRSSSSRTRTATTSPSQCASARSTAGIHAQVPKLWPDSLERSSRAADCSSTEAIRYERSRCPQRPEAHGVEAYPAIFCHDERSPLARAHRDDSRRLRSTPESRSQRATTWHSRLASPPVCHGMAAVRWRRFVGGGHERCARPASPSAG